MIYLRGIIALLIFSAIGLGTNGIQAYENITELFPPSSTISPTSSSTSTEGDVEQNPPRAYDISAILPYELAKIPRNIADFYYETDQKYITDISLNLEKLTVPKEIDFATFEKSYAYSCPYSGDVSTKLYVKNVSCEFFSSLKVNIEPEDDYFTLSGHFNKTKNVTTYFTAPYKLYFRGISISYQAKHTSPTNITETDVTIKYENYKIELSGNDGEEFDTPGAMSSLIQELKAFSKLILKEKIISILHSTLTYNEILSTCLQPKKNINQKLSTDEQEYYYEIRKNSEDQKGVVINRLTIQGLTNFKTFTLAPKSHQNEIEILIKNITGYMNWNYYNEQFSSTNTSRFNFSIDSIFIKALTLTKQRDAGHSYWYPYSLPYTIQNEEVRITGANIVDKNFNDNFALLAKGILLEDAKAIIISSIHQSINYEHQLLDSTRSKFFPE